MGTMITYCIYAVVVSAWSLKVFRFEIDYGHILLYLALSLIMYVVVMNVNMESHLFSMFSKVGVGVTVYGLLLMVFDRQVRREVRGELNFHRGSFAKKQGEVELWRGRK